MHGLCSEKHKKARVRLQPPGAGTGDGSQCCPGSPDSRSPWASWRGPRSGQWCWSHGGLVRTGSAPCKPRLGPRGKRWWACSDTGLTGSPAPLGVAFAPSSQMVPPFFWKAVAGAQTLHSDCLGSNPGFSTYCVNSASTCLSFVPHL